MIKLKDSIEIQTTPTQLFNWLASISEEYVSWHPDHVACRVLKGSILQPGSELECKEYLHGKMHTMRFRPTRVDPGKRIEYEILTLGKGVFEIIPKGKRVEFVAELALGSDAPVVNYLIDAVLHILFNRRLKAMQEHMREEGQNLKKIIESGWNPKVTP